MEGGKIKKNFIILAFAFLGWLFCGTVIAIGKKVASLEAVLVIHAISAPVIFGIISAVYYKKFGGTSPLYTAVFFLLFIVSMDVFVVAPFFEKSYAMFRSILGTWIPFMLIFLSVYFTGLFFAKNIEAD